MFYSFYCVWCQWCVVYMWFCNWLCLWMRSHPRPFDLNNNTYYIIFKTVINTITSRKIYLCSSEPFCSCCVLQTVKCPSCVSTSRTTKKLSSMDWDSILSILWSLQKIKEHRIEKCGSTLMLYGHLFKYIYCVASMALLAGRTAASERMLCCSI